MGTISLIAGLVLIGSGYTFLMVRLRIGWKSLGGCREIRDAVKVSVVIAARNEEKNIQACLDGLANQHYPRDRFEVILVDDHSGDRTVQVAEACIRRHPELNFRVHSSSASPGKKAALREGLKLASGEIVLTTDADCVPNPGWIRAMTAALLEKDAVFVSAGGLREPVRIFREVAGTGVALADCFRRRSHRCRLSADVQRRKSRLFDGGIQAA